MDTWEVHLPSPASLSHVSLLGTGSYILKKDPRDRSVVLYSTAK